MDSRSSERKSTPINLEHRDHSPFFRLPDFPQCVGIKGMSNGLYLTSQIIRDNTEVKETYHLNLQNLKNPQTKTTIAEADCEAFAVLPNNNLIYRKEKIIRIKPINSDPETPDICEFKKSENLSAPACFLILDANRFVMGDSEGYIHVFDINKKSFETIIELNASASKGKITCLIWWPSKNCLVSGDACGNIFLIDREKKTAAFYTNVHSSIQNLFLSSDEKKLLVVNLGGVSTVKSNKEMVNAIPVIEGQICTAIEIKPFTKHFIVLGYSNGLIKIWDWSDSKKLIPLTNFKFVSTGLPLISLMSHFSDYSLICQLYTGETRIYQIRQIQQLLNEHQKQCELIKTEIQNFFPAVLSNLTIEYIREFDYTEFSLFSNKNQPSPHSPKPVHATPYKKS